MLAPVNHSPRHVLCYHCGASVTSTASARSTSCPTCNRRLLLDDIVVEAPGMWSGQLETCGRVTIRPAARLSTRTITASESIDLAGYVTAHLACRGHVSIRDRATLKGDCRAASLEVEPGARLSGQFEIGPLATPPAADAS